MDNEMVPLLAQVEPPPSAHTLVANCAIVIPEDLRLLQESVYRQNDLQRGLVQAASGVLAINEELYRRDNRYKQRVAKLQQDLERERGIGQELRVRNKVGERD